MSERAVRVAVVKINNILGLTSAEIRPGRVTLIEGRNGEGKTSVLEAIRAALSGGHDATLLRKGADHGEVVLVLDDGTEIRKTVTMEGSKTKVTSADVGTISRPAGFLDKLRDAFALNPVDFLLAKKDARLQLLLAAIPMKLNQRDLSGVLPHCTIKPNFDAHAMLALNAIEKDLYDARTGVNRVVKEKRTTAQEMAKALPPEATGGDAVAADLKEAKKALRLVGEMWGEKVKALNDEADRKKFEARQAFETEMAKLRDRLNGELEAINAAAQAGHETLNADRLEVEQDIVKTIADLEAKAETYTRTETTRQHLAELSKSADKHQVKSEQLTAALTELDEIRGALLDELPIKGVSVVDGDILVDGIPFDRLNESRRVRLAIDIAMLRAGSLPILCCDGIESLDSASLQALEEAAVESGIQLVLARVTDGALKVEVVA